MFGSNTKRLNVEGEIRYTTGQLQAPTSKALAEGRSSLRKTEKTAENKMLKVIRQCLKLCFSGCI